MKMETVEHFAQIALVTHLLGRQQPLGGEDLEKLKLARTKYQVASSVLPLPCSAVTRDNGRLRSNVGASQMETATRQRNKDFRSPLKAKS
jgi:hypothetical protein